MIEFATKTSLMFFPVAHALETDSTGDKMTTQNVTMGDLARLTYIKCRVRGAIAFSEPATAEIKVSAMLNGVERASQTVSVSGNTLGGFDFPVNLSDATGDDSITLKWAVVTAAAEGITAALSGALDVEHPLIIGA